MASAITPEPTVAMVASRSDMRPSIGANLTGRPRPLNAYLGRAALWVGPGECRLERVARPSRKNREVVSTWRR